MTETELSEKLRSMRENAPHGCGVAMILLFGIIHSKELKEQSPESRHRIIRRAGLQEAYYTEISKGISLAAFVNPKPEWTFGTEDDKIAEDNELDQIQVEQNRAVQRIDRYFPSDKNDRNLKKYQRVVKTAIEGGCTDETAINKNWLMDATDGCTEGTIASMCTEGGNSYGRYFVNGRYGLTFDSDVWQALIRKGWVKSNEQV